MDDHQAMRLQEAIRTAIHGGLQEIVLALLGIQQHAHSVAIAVTEISDALAPGVKPSPAYVRGLRDRAAVELMVHSRDGAIRDARWVVECNGGSVSLGDVLAEWARVEADALVKALGYEPPGED